MAVHQYVIPGDPRREEGELRTQCLVWSVGYPVVRGNFCHRDRSSCLGACDQVYNVTEPAVVKFNASHGRPPIRGLGDIPLNRGLVGL